MGSLKALNCLIQWLKLRSTRKYVGDFQLYCLKMFPQIEVED